jgi:hypothetical protein
MTPIQIPTENHDPKMRVIKALMSIFLDLLTGGVEAAIPNAKIDPVK